MKTIAKPIDLCGVWLDQKDRYIPFLFHCPYMGILTKLCEPSVGGGGDS